MTLLFIPGDINVETWVSALQNVDPDLDLKIEVWPEVEDPKQVEFALVRLYPHGELQKYPRLKCISSLGAGVNQLLDDPFLPKNVPIVRVVDACLTRDMTQYVTGAVLNHTRHFDYYRESQARQLWTPRALLDTPRIGVMGLGELGRDVAIKLKDLGFVVSSYSQSPKHVLGIHHFYGARGLPPFLNQTDILVCLLPLTPKTRHILNAKTFSQLPRGAYVINVGRGDHLVEEDLLAAIQEGQISGACLDVFCQEPLPKDHPFWQQPQIIVTPHIASVTNAQSVAPQIIENYKRAMQGKPLLNVVNISQGY